MKWKKGYKLCMAGIIAFIGLAGNTVNAEEMQESTSGYIELPCEDEIPALTTGAEDGNLIESVAATLGLQESEVEADLESYYVTGELPEIRNQGEYGACWAFASSALGEIGMWKSEQVQMNLSELHLAYFTYSSIEDPLGGTEGDLNYLGASASNFLQQGGNMMLALQALANWKGAASEELVPYENCEEVLAQGIDESYAYEDVAHLKNAYIVNLSEDRDEAKLLIKQYGGIAASYYSGYAYYNETYNSYYNTHKTSANHAITIVGWDDDFPKENFNTEASEDGAWLVRNSWGVNGESYYGYFWMSYAEGTLSKAAYAFEFVSNESDEYYDNNYQYDGGIYYLKSVPVSEGNSITTSNVFEVQKEEELLKAVSFETYATNEEYEISIYTDLLENDNPESGILVQTISGETSFAGLYTIEVNELSLTEGQKYSVVVTLTREDGNPSMMMEYEYNSWLVCETSAQAGQSFVKENGIWTDYGAAYDRNIRIKAYTNTVSVTETEPEATEIVLSEESVTLEHGQNVVLTATLDGTGEVQWSSDDTSVVSVESGKLTAVGYGIAVITAQAGDIIAECYVYVYPPAITVDVTATEEGIHIISWNLIDGVTGYQIYRYDVEEEEESLIADLDTSDMNSGSISYEDTIFLDDNNYGYYVVAYVESSKGTVESDVTDWGYVRYLLTYQLAGGTNSEKNPVSYYYNDEVITLENPTREGYQFDGWYLDEDYQNEVMEIDPAEHSIFTLYAKWKKTTENVRGDIEENSDNIDNLQSSNDNQADDQVEDSSDSFVHAGDRTNIEQWIALLASGMGCMWLYFARKKTRLGIVKIGKR